MSPYSSFSGESNHPGRNCFRRCINKLSCEILDDRILRRDKCAYRETTADSSIEPRAVLDHVIVIVQGLLILVGIQK